MADARRRKFDLVAVAALDRLGRNLRHLVVPLDELQHLNVGPSGLSAGRYFDVFRGRHEIRTREAARSWLYQSCGGYPGAAGQ
ncbi:MAG: recombinase family protein [Deltaproteobacteria bacterium]|nr:recombinase family protein [Deltaproteobacteria bacterium]